MPIWGRQAVLWLLKKLLKWVVQRASGSLQKAPEGEGQDSSAEMETQPNWVDIRYQEIGDQNAYLVAVDTAQHTGGVFQVKGTNTQLNETTSDRCKAGLHVMEIFSMTAPAALHITWREKGKEEQTVALLLCTKSEPLKLTTFLDACQSSHIEIRPLQHVQFPVV